MPLMQQPLIISAAGRALVAVRVLRELAEARDADPFALEQVLDRVGVAGPLDPLVAHEQDVVQLELRRQRAGAGDDAGPEDQPGPGLPVDEGGKDGEVHVRDGCLKQSIVWSFTMPTACMNA